MNRRFCNGMVHVIKEGENLYQLSRAYRVPLALLLRANPYVDVYNLQVGQEICIPVARPFGGMMRPPMGRQGRSGGSGRPQEAPRQNDRKTPEADLTESEERRDREKKRLEEARERLEDERERQEEEREHREKMERREKEERRDVPEMRRQEERRDAPEMRGQAEEERGTDSHVSDGTKSFGEILRENGITAEAFFAVNDPNQITIAADVIYELPKKV